MRNSPGTTKPLLLRVAIAALLPVVLLAGCEPADPLEAIRRQQASGDYQGSLEPLRALLDESRDDSETAYLYGRALAVTGQASLAEWSLRRAMEDPEWLLPAGTQLAFGSLSTGNYESCIETAGRILEAHPDNVAVLLIRAKAHARWKLNSEAALVDVERIFELDPDNLDAMEPQIFALLSLDRADDAGAAIEELGERIDEADLGEGMLAWHCATTAIFADESDEPELAEERWSRCLEHYPGHPNVVEKGVNFYDAKKDYARSLAILRAAYAAEPASRSYRVTLSERLRQAGETAEAEALLRAATESEAGTQAAEAWLDLAMHQQEVEQLAAAAESVERAVEAARQLGEPSPQLLLEQADALVLAGEFDRALAVAEGMGLDAHRTMIRARVAQDRGRPAEALEYFDEAFLLWPDNPWARYQAALAAEAAGDFDRAIEEYRYSIRIAAGETDARVRIARLLLAEGKPDQAQQLLRLKAEEWPLDLEGELLSLEMWAWLGNQQPVGQSLGRFQRGSPENFGRAVASAAEGLRARSGPAAALEVLRGWESEGLIDFTDARQAAALRAWLRLANEAGSLPEAETRVRAALRAHPDSPALHASLGLALELGGAPAAEARAAYEEALSLAPDDAHALAGLGRLALADDPAGALRFFERALAADPDAVGAQRSAARALAASGRAGRAAERLEALLLAHPTDAAAAVQLAELRLEQGDVSDATLKLARRAIRFGGGAEAQELSSRVQRQRNDPTAAGPAEAAGGPSGG